MVEVPRCGTVIVSALLMVSPVLRTGARQTAGAWSAWGSWPPRPRPVKQPSRATPSKRFLCRQGHAEKLGRLARSTAQLLLFRARQQPWVDAAARCRGSRTVIGVARTPTHSAEATGGSRPAEDRLSGVSSSF